MKTFFTLLILILISSCTITKKMHRPGWHIEWHKKNSVEKSDRIVEDHLSISKSLTQFTDSIDDFNVLEQNKNDVFEDHLMLKDIERKKEQLVFDESLMRKAKNLEKSVSKKENEDERIEKKLVKDFVYDKGSFAFFMLSCVFFVLFLVVLFVNPTFTLMLPVFGKSFLLVILAVLNMLFGIAAILSHAFHLMPKKERVKKVHELSKRTEMRSNQRIKRPLFVVACVLLLVGLVLLILFKYSAIFNPIILSFFGIVLVAAALFIFILFMRYHLNDLHDQGKLFNRYLRLGLFFLFASLVVSLFITVLFALNGWLLITAAISTFEQTMAILAIILAPVAIVFALIGIGNIASVPLGE